MIYKNRSVIHLVLLGNRRPFADSSFKVRDEAETEVDFATTEDSPLSELAVDSLI